SSSSLASEKESFQLRYEEVRDLLGDVVPRGKRVATHVAGDPLPFRERIEAAPDDAMLAPQRKERRLHLAAGLAVGAVVLEVDAGGGAVVLARGMDRLGRVAALVLGPRLGSEGLHPGEPRAHLLPQQELRIRADHR